VTTKVTQFFVKEFAKRMAEHTKTTEGRKRVQDFLNQEYPDMEIIDVLKIVNYHDIQRGKRARAKQRAN
jgi:hypothetical protein